MSFSNSHFTYISQMLPAQPQTLQQLDTNIYAWPYCEAPNASAAFPSCPPATSHEQFPMYYQSVPYQGNSLAACPASFATMQNDKVLDISARRQKKGRAMQACEHCRVKKQRCDEGSPCAFCRENGLDCVYRPTVDTKGDKTVELMLSWMAAHAEALHVLAQKLDRLSEKACGYHDDIAPQHNLMWPTISGEDATKPRLTTPSDGSPCSGCPAASSTAAAFLSWPKINQVITACGIALHQDYLIAAEDRPVLPLRARTNRETISSYEGEGPPEESELASQPNTAILSECNIRLLFSRFTQHLLPSQPFLRVPEIEALLERFTDKHGEYGIRKQEHVGMDEVVSVHVACHQVIGLRVVLQPRWIPVPRLVIRMDIGALVLRSRCRGS